VINIKTKQFRVKENEKVDLKKRATSYKKDLCPEKLYKKMLAEQSKTMNALQSLLYASDRNALLIIFQGMDAAGKDGTIKHVMSGVNPQGCQVFSFKHPSAKELQHDFLWRTTRDLPERGRIGIFNRSYYEEVLITRVHTDLLDSENRDNDVHHAHGRKKLWKERFRSITDLERHLHRNGTQVIKFFLHLSKDEQKDRFLERIDDPDKNWKLSPDDIKERAFWDDYQHAYEECLGHTSTEIAPWYVVPADDKLSARLIVSTVIIETLEAFDMKYPEVKAARAEELKVIRKELTSKG
jgi:PPK2 family polyphosphate:nucleotide phosphotransferase